MPPEKPQSVTDDRPKANAAGDTPAGADKAGSDDARSTSLDEELARLTKEFEDGGAKATDDAGDADAAKATDIEAKIAALEKKFDRVDARDRDAQTNELLDGTTKAIMGFDKDIAKRYDPSDVEALFVRAAEKDDRLAAAFINQGRDPAAYNRVLTAFAKGLGDKARNGSGDADADDARAAASAAGGASATLPSPDNLPSSAEISNLSDSEFDKLWREQQSAG